MAAGGAKRDQQSLLFDPVERAQADAQVLNRVPGVENPPADGVRFPVRCSSFDGYRVPPADIIRPNLIAAPSACAVLTWICVIWDAYELKGGGVVGGWELGPS